jgi:hypothetical protein
MTRLHILSFAFGREPARNTSCAHGASSNEVDVRRRNDFSQRFMFSASCSMIWNSSSGKHCASALSGCNKAINGDRCLRDMEDNGTG